MKFNDFLDKIKIKPKEICEPFIIAEAGVNHAGDLDLAKRLIREAKEGGADAIKFQTYKAETIASKNSPSYWDLSKEPTTSQFELFKKFDKFNEYEYEVLFNYCNEIGIEFSSTPFDSKSIDFLDPFLSFYKIASADITNTPFLRQIAKKNKPIILSTGCSTIGEIDQALDILYSNDAIDIILLHCVLNYPTPDNLANLSMLSHLKHSYPNNIIGYSDHTVPDSEMSQLMASFYLGAKIIEKHFTHDKLLEGNDHYHAMDKDDCINFKKRIANAINLMGNSTIKGPLKTEIKSIQNARRSIVTSKEIKKNEFITLDNITYKRPGTGISPLFWDEIIGMKVIHDLPDDHILTWSDLQK